MTEEWIGWHWLRTDRKLGYNDNRQVIVGEVLEVQGHIKLCERGLHASKGALDAVCYAPGPICCRVRLSGRILESQDKAVATERTVLAMFDGTAVLTTFTRWCAMQVASLWGMPDIVRQYLETGDDALRAEATSLALDAATYSATTSSRYAAAVTRVAMMERYNERGVQEAAARAAEYACQALLNGGVMPYRQARMQLEEHLEAMLQDALVQAQETHR